MSGRGASWVLPVLAAFVAAGFGHAVVGRLRPGWNFAMSYVGMAGAGGVGLAACTLAAGTGWESAVSGLLLYAAGVELYLFLMTLPRSSVSAQMLLALRGGARPVAELRVSAATEGGDADVVTERLRRLVAVRLLTNGSGSWHVTALGTRVVAVYWWLRRLFGHLPPEGPLA